MSWGMRATQELYWLKNNRTNWIIEPNQFGKCERNCQRSIETLCRTEWYENSWHLINMFQFEGKTTTTHCNLQNHIWKCLFCQNSDICVRCVCTMHMCQFTNCCILQLDLTICKQFILNSIDSDAEVRLIKFYNFYMEYKQQQKLHAY